MTTLPPVTRTTDPMPSRVGESEVTNSGKRQSLVAEVVAYVRAHPGQCRGEIAQGLGIDEYPLSKRLSDSARLGFTYMDGSKRFASRLQGLWWPVVAEPRQMDLPL